MTAQTLKEQLIQELDRLPENRLREVLDFVEYILTKEGKRVAPKPPEELGITEILTADAHFAQVGMDMTIVP